MISSLISSFTTMPFGLLDLLTKLGSKLYVTMLFLQLLIALAFFPARNVPKDRNLTEEELMEPPQGYPSSSILLRKHEAKFLAFISFEFGGITVYERIIAALKDCHAIAIRTCKELEGEFCEYIASQFQKPVLLSGPLLPEQDKTPLENRWAEWFGKFQPGSVVFCTFGSQVILERSNFRSFFWGLS